MKTNLIAFLLLASVSTGLCQTNQTNQTNQQTAQSATLRRIDPLAMKMQHAVLVDQDLQEIADLLKQGVDINAPIGCGTFNPLDGAVAKGNVDMLKFLLAHGAKPQDRQLADAAFMDNHQIALEMARILLTAGVSPNATNRYSTALTSAAYEDNEELVALLLAQPGIKVDQQDVDGYSAVMWAGEHGSLNLVNSLLDAGASLNLANRQGETGLTLVKQAIARDRAAISRVESKLKLKTATAPASITATFQ